MEIYLVRHTTPNVEKGICYGQSDLGVVDSFSSEVENIHAQIPSDNIAKVYSSPLLRCKLLAETFQKQVIYDDRLKELNFGDWELKPWNAINSKELDPWMKDFVNTKVPNGESYVDLQKRMLDFFLSLDHTIDEKNIIVSHAGVIRSLIAYIQDIALKDSFSIALDYGHIITLRTTSSAFNVTSGLNLT